MSFSYFSFSFWILILSRLSISLARLILAFSLRISLVAMMVSISFARVSHTNLSWTYLHEAVVESRIDMLLHVFHDVLARAFVLVLPGDLLLC